MTSTENKKKLGMIQRVPVDGMTSLDLELRLNHVEKGMVAQVAGLAHSEGMRFESWPHIERARLVWTRENAFGLKEAESWEKPHLIELRLSVTAVDQ